MRVFFTYQKEVLNRYTDHERKRWKCTGKLTVFQKIRHCNVKFLNIVRPLLSTVPGRTKFWSQKPWII